MDCREVRTHISGFIDGSYDITKLDDYIWHVLSCPACREELADRLRLHMALEAFDEDTDEDELLDMDARKRLTAVLDRARGRVLRYQRYRQIKAGLNTAAYWAVGLAFFLQVLFWRYMGMF